MEADLRRLLERGVRSDVFQAEQSFYVFKAIGERAAELNASSSGYGPFFRYLQHEAQDSVVMALGRAFDVPSKRYPTRCFLGLVEYLEDNIDSMPAIVEKPQLFRAMASAGFNVDRIDTLRSSEDVEISSEIVSFFRGLVESMRTQQILNKAKDLRDKVVAHNEDAVEVNAPAWNELRVLISLAQRLIGVVGWAYLGFGYFIDGEYILSEDARRVSIALGRMIDEVT